MSALSRRLAALEQRQPAANYPVESRKAIADLFSALAVAQGLAPDRAPDEAKTCAMADRIKVGVTTAEDEAALASLPSEALAVHAWSPEDFVAFLAKAYLSC